LFDATHVVPTPFNGQLIALYALSAFFFGATLALIAKRLGAASRWFIGLALLFAACHFGTVGKFLQFIPGYLGLLSPWSPCFVILPFLCFIVAAASVAAGNGKDLLLMVLAACFLVHGHVAMPLFVVPLTLVAYGALWLEAHRAGRQPWNFFRRQHWLAGATIALFLLPIAINVFATRPNNVERIVEHLRTNYGEGKGMLQSTLNFLHFGAYAAYPSQHRIPAFESFDAKGLLSFFLLHWRAYALWLGSILLLFATMRPKAGEDSQQQEIGKFRRRMYLILIVATGLSVVWGCIQEGPMFDYNALFNFAIYYGWLLVVALNVAVWIEERFSSWRARAAHSAAQSRTARVQTAGLIALTLAIAVAFIDGRRGFRAAPNEDQQRLFAASIERALVLDPAQPKFLNFDSPANGQAEGVALYLERRGIRWWVREDWPLIFGEDRTIRTGRIDQPVPTLASSFWRIALHSNPFATEGDPRAIVVPLTPEVDLVIHPGR
jgi:hypothetical protein